MDDRVRDGRHLFENEGSRLLSDLAVPRAKTTAQDAPGATISTPPMPQHPPECSGSPAYSVLHDEWRCACGAVRITRAEVALSPLLEQEEAREARQLMRLEGR